MSSILPQEVISQSLQKLHVAWAAVGNDYIVRTFKTADFAAGVGLINKIALVAESQQHHPDVALSFNRVEVRSSTHDVAGITQKDITFAAALDRAVNGD